MHKQGKYLHKVDWYIIIKTTGEGKKVVSKSNTKPGVANAFDSPKPLELVSGVGIEI